MNEVSVDDYKKLSPEYLEQLSFPELEDQIDEDGPSTRREITGGSGSCLSEAERRERSFRARAMFEQVLDGEHAEECKWFDTYLQLSGLQWPWRVACYVAWASSPKINRWPKTQDELAREVLGLTSDRVIAEWRKKNPEIDSTIALLQAAPMLAHRRDVIDALITSASDPDHRSHQDRKLFFEMTGDYTPRSRVDVRQSADEDGLAGVSEAELIAAAKRAKERRGDE